MNLWIHQDCVGMSSARKGLDESTLMVKMLRQKNAEVELRATFVNPNAITGIGRSNTIDLP